jgi:(p)ppGpp synthase/HD superfamily hydrolase
VQDTLEKAIAIALEAHKGKIDKGGNPYILHPLRVMLNMDDTEGKIVAVLHDVFEDSFLRLEQLSDLELSNSAKEALVLLTRKKSQTYDDYILEIKKNTIARNVKLADLRDNMDLSRIKVLSEKDNKRIEKYQKAYNCLNS